MKKNTEETLNEIFKISKKHLYKPEYSYKRNGVSVIVGGLEITDKTRMAIKYIDKANISINAKYTDKKKINRQAYKTYFRLQSELYEKGYIDEIQSEKTS